MVIFIVGHGERSGLSTRTPVPPSYYSAAATGDVVEAALARSLDVRQIAGYLKSWAT